MAELLQPARTVPVPLPSIPGFEVDERAARVTLRRQIAKLEGELARALGDSRPGDAAVLARRRARGPRLLALGDLEQIRDELSTRLAELRGHIAERADREAEKRALLERMLLDPGRHRWVRITQAELGEPGCGAYHVRPKLGVVGMLAGWWQVKVSSGCPLGPGPRAERGPAPPT